MQLHHIGCIVTDTGEAIENYRNLMGGTLNVSPVYSITDQKVSVCFLEMANGVFLELVQPHDPESSLARINRKKGVNFYHLGYKVGDIDQKIEALQKDGYHMVSTFFSEAFEMKKCAFLYSPEMHLIELIQN